MLSETITTFESQSTAIAAFKAFAADCIALTTSDADNAAAYLLLAFSARQTIDDYEGQPISVEDMGAAKDHVVSFARAIEGALNGSADAKLAALNSLVSAQLKNHPF